MFASLPCHHHTASGSFLFPILFTLSKYMKYPANYFANQLFAFTFITFGYP